MLKHDFPAAHRVVSRRAQNRRLSAHRAADGDGRLLPAAAERSHHPARRASGVVGGGLNLFQFHLSGWPAQIGIVIAGAFGSWLGASAMYWLVRVAGRPLVLRYGRFVLFPPEKLEKAERWMSHYGAMGVFVARMLPGRAATGRHSHRHRADGLPVVFHLSRCWARSSGVRCFAMSA